MHPEFCDHLLVCREASASDNGNMNVAGYQDLTDCKMIVVRDLLATKIKDGNGRCWRNDDLFEVYLGECI